MARVYSVHVKTGGMVDPVRDVVFVREGFSAAAVVFGGFWLVWHRMWGVLAGYAGIVLALTGLSYFGGLPSVIPTSLNVAVAFILGFEGGNLRRWWLGQTGFEEVAVTSGSSRIDSEERYFVSRYGAASAEPAGVHAEPVSGAA